jgi:hypothetical protein
MAQAFYDKDPKAVTKPTSTQGLLQQQQQPLSCLATCDSCKLFHYLRYFAHSHYSSSNLYIATRWTRRSFLAQCWDVNGRASEPLVDATCATVIWSHSHVPGLSQVQQGTWYSLLPHLVLISYLNPILSVLEKRSWRMQLTYCRLLLKLNVFALGSTTRQSASMLQV